MAVEELQVLRLKDDFYRDGFKKIIFSIVVIASAIVFLIAVSIYLYVTIPPPVYFMTDKEWRTIPPVPINQTQPKFPLEADLLQWVEQVFMNVFTYDFLNYDQIRSNSPVYFTENGWKKFQDILNRYINRDSLLRYKWITHSTPTGAPYVTREGLLTDRYAWWIKVPMRIDYESFEKTAYNTFTMNVLVVRIPTLNNLYGVAIDDIMIAVEPPNTQRTNVLNE